MTVTPAAAGILTAAAPTVAATGGGFASGLSAAAAAAGLIGSGLSAYGQMQQGEAASKAAKYQAAVAQNNAKATLARGEFEAQQIYRQGAQRLSLQRAIMGANNLDIGFGTALDVQRDTAEATGLDAATTRYNALLAGTDQSQQAMLLRAQGAGARSAGTMGAFGSILSGASQFAQRWNGWQDSGSSPRSRAPALLA
ncbi:hypothetical protein [Siccirubricoccus phaeus]|uniref:hypothetical protein n=1 Tax=Siccirubricoccus phaeus TaxID=2595053 RepID=UPI0011F1B160|nr:hypothetical protein [Siccirubricoccus phaeus]